MKNFDWCAYTYKHRKMFVYIANKLIKDEEMKAAILERAKYHDVDKLLLYMFLDQDISQKHHVVTHKHHLECNEEKSYIDLLETVIDCECSPYTKPDKPLNAFDFLNKLLEMKLVSTEIATRLFDIMHELGIDYSYSYTKDSEGVAYAQTIENVTEEMILLEVLDYVKNTDADELNYIKNLVSHN